MKRYIHTKHGYKRKGMNVKEYSAWHSMKQRCLNPNNPKFKHYGGRGITICDSWKTSFVNFLADMGKAPSLQHSLDRRNNDGNYEPSNCQWATASQQRTNQRPTKRKRVSTRLLQKQYALLEQEYLELKKKYNVLLIQQRVLPTEDSTLTV